MTAIAIVPASDRLGSSEPRVGLATPEDLERILEAVHALSQRGAARGERGRWSELLTRTDARVIVAEESGQIVGVGWVRGQPIGELEILVARRAAARIAPSIGYACMTAARELGAAVLLGKVCPPSELIASSYEGLGFRLVQVLRSHDELESGSWADAHVFAIALERAES